MSLEAADGGCDGLVQYAAKLADDAGDEVVDLPPAALGDVALEFSPERQILLDLRLPGLLARELARQRHVGHLVIEAEGPVRLLSVRPPGQRPVNIAFNELVSPDLCGDPRVDFARRLSEPRCRVGLEGRSHFRKVVADGQVLSP